MLHGVAVDLLVDVRSVPRSRTNPQFNADVLPGTLKPHGIGYRYIRALGGWKRTSGATSSPNAYWQNASFRAYADYAGTEAFRAGFEELCDLAAEHCCAVMCAEALWWRCHRRIIADYLLARGFAVAHILGLHHVEPAVLTPAAQALPGGALVYPAAAPG